MAPQGQLSVCESTPFSKQQGLPGRGHPQTPVARFSSLPLALEEQKGGRGASFLSVPCLAQSQPLTIRGLPTL